jgi:hypothetical protein
MNEIIEPGDGSQKAIKGKLLVVCDCEYTERCPNGKPMGSNRCVVRIEERRLRRKEVERLKAPQR